MSDHPFRLLQPADHVVKVLRRTRYRMVGRPEQVQGEFPSGMVVRWHILTPAGKVLLLSFERRRGKQNPRDQARGLENKSALCYRVIGIEEGPVPKRPQQRRRRQRRVSADTQARVDAFVQEVKRGG